MSSLQKIGVVVSTNDSPNTTYFFFIINNLSIKKGHYVFVPFSEKKIFGQIIEIILANRYFQSFEAVADISNKGGMENFPINEWEYAIAKVKVIGTLDKEAKFERCFFPPKCGEEVFIASSLDLKKIFQFSDDGLNLGKVLHHETEVVLDVSKFLGKHLAILAMSGAGKSYFSSVLIEELLSLKKGNGRIAIVVFDSHKDYTFFTNSSFKENVVLIDAKKLKINYLSIGIKKLVQLVGITDKATFTLSKYFELFKKEKKENGKIPPSLDELINIIENDKINENTKSALLSALSSLRNFKFISNKDSFKYKIHGPKPGRLLIFDLSSIDKLEHKQLIVHYYLSKFFNGTKKKRYPPTLAIIEEAHNFCPEKEKATQALSRDIINTIAREGRKFFFSLCLISQRPVHLSTTALSQCTSNIILKVTNPSDLEHIEQSAESIDSQSINFISSLEVGSALIIGEALRFPIFLSVRKRKTELIKNEKTFQQAAKEFEEQQKEKEEELEAYF